MYDDLQRMQIELRKTVDYYINQGFEVINRDPLTVQRGTQVLHIAAIGSGVAINAHSVTRTAMN